MLLLDLTIVWFWISLLSRQFIFNICGYTTVRQRHDYGPRRMKTSYKIHHEMTLLYLWYFQNQAPIQLQQPSSPDNTLDPPALCSFYSLGLASTPLPRLGPLRKWTMVLPWTQTLLHSLDSETLQTLLSWMSMVRPSSTQKWIFLQGIVLLSLSLRCSVSTTSHSFLGTRLSYRLSTVKHRTHWPVLVPVLWVNWASMEIIFEGRWSG